MPRSGGPNCRRTSPGCSGGYQEDHDAVPDEEDGEVPGDVLLVAQRRREAVLDQVVKEVHTKKDDADSKGQVPGVVRQLEQHMK